MKKITIIFLIALFLAGCNSTNSLEETITSEQALTVIAQTVEAGLATANAPTETLMQSPTLEPSLTPSLSPSPTVENTATLTPQSINPPASNLCDNAEFVSDVTIPDGTIIEPGEAFTKTWRIQNTGTCTWTSAYAVGFANGENMGATSPISLIVETVASGSIVDISIGMIAPETNGEYTSYWQMQNAAGAGFGAIFYVEIIVREATEDPEATLENTLTPTETVITSTPTETVIAPTPTETAITPTPTGTEQSGSGATPTP